MSMRNEGENRSRPGRSIAWELGRSQWCLNWRCSDFELLRPWEKRGLVLVGVRLAGLGQEQEQGRVGLRKSMMDDSMSRSSVRRSFLHVTGSQRSENAAAPKKVDI